MKKIAVLDQNTIDKIAAGEVVERPSSVVKELVENAIDAGATAVTVEITDGGKKLIRITDNGSGMESEQIPLAFLRHATSKIEKVEDLDDPPAEDFCQEQHCCKIHSALLKELPHIHVLPHSRMHAYSAQEKGMQISDIPGTLQPFSKNRPDQMFHHL